MPVSNWSTTPSDNDDSDLASGIDLRSGIYGSQMDDNQRAMMAAIKGWFNTVGEALPFQCRLVYVSAASIRLDRCDGSWIFINGAVYQIPATGPTLSNAGLSANTTYYVYAYVSGSTITLEASTTGYSADSTYGHKIKTGDATRVLVGLVRANGSSLFYDNDAGVGVASYYNRRLRSTYQDLANQTSSTTTLAYLTAANSMLCWDDEAVHHQVTGSMLNSTAATSACVAAVDSVARGLESKGYSAVADASCAVSSGFADNVSIGYHTFGAGIYVTAGSGRWDITLSTLTRC